MIKNGKAFTIIVIIIFILFGILEVYKFYEKNLYSLENVEKLLNSVKMPENFKVKETILNSSNEIIGSVNYSNNDKGTYIYQENNLKEIIEQIYDFENRNHITINHCEKIITDNSIDESYMNFKLLGTNTFFTCSYLTKNNLNKYNYEGKISIEGRKCIKVSFLSNDEGKINKYIFYIDINNYYILKLEAYSGNKLNTLQKDSTEIYEYLFNIQNDNDTIFKFNIEDYPDYQYISNYK